MFFLLVSVIFWFLSALGKTYTTRVNLPLKYEQFPADKLLVSDMTRSLKLELSGFGFSLLQFNLGLNKHSLHFNFREENLQLRTDGSTDKYFILTSSLRDNIRETLPSDLELVSISPDSLVFLFDQMDSKLLPVNRNSFSFSFQRQFMQTGELRIKPDTVMVFGPESQLDTLQAIDPVKKRYTNLSAPLETMAMLYAPGNAKIEPAEVKVQLPVSEYTERRMSLPVEVENKPQDIRLRMFPDKVRLSFHVGLNDYSLVEQESFRAVVDYKDVDDNINNKIKIQLKQKPNFVSNIRMQPNYIEYIIEKK